MTILRRRRRQKWFLIFKPCLWSKRLMIISLIIEITLWHNIVNAYMLKITGLTILHCGNIRKQYCMKICDYYILILIGPLLQHSINLKKANYYLAIILLIRKKSKILVRNNFNNVLFHLEELVGCSCVKKGWNRVGVDMGRE